MLSATKSKRGFTLIELLVVIVIIGVLVTLSTVVISSSRAKARDEKRISDIKQIQTALELYYTEQGGYPTTLNFGVPLTNAAGTATFMAKVPTSPKPRAEGACRTDSDYVYKQTNDGAAYILSYCLAKDGADMTAGQAVATPSNIHCRPTAGQACCSNPVVAYNGIHYRTLFIDIDGDNLEDSGECWFKDNLATTKKPDRTPLVKTVDYHCVGTVDRAEDCASSVTGTTSTLGYLYTWSAAMNSSTAELAQGLCPAGWHIPSEAEWYNLENYLKITGNSCDANRTDESFACGDAGGAMREAGSSTTTWQGLSNPPATNSSGLSIRGAGYNYSNLPLWLNRGESGYQWSSSLSDTDKSWSRQFNYGSVGVRRYSASHYNFFSVRCVKD